MRVLVTGGAGYIGSHTVVALARAGYVPVIVDSYVNSSPEVLSRLDELTGLTLESHTLDLTDEPATADLMRRVEVDAVIHFAALKAVGESTQRPLDYYRNNLQSALSVLRAMSDAGVHSFVFSSSATVYGDQAPVPYVESYQPLSSSNPYGRTKVMIEQILSDACVADDRLRVASLRYFNPIGADPSGRIGEDPLGIPNNLLPFIAQVAVGKRERLSIFGNDYPTADGTCERDYLHVVDLAAGHVAALDRIQSAEPGIDAWNLGTGNAVSVLDIVRAFEQASGQRVPYEFAPRRPGDLPAFWADATKAADELGWRATLGLEQMCADTWRWQSMNPDGYRTG